MAESSDSVSIDIDMVPLGEKVKQPPQQKKKKMKNPPRKFYFLYLFLFYSNARLHFYFFSLVVVLVVSLLYICCVFGCMCDFFWLFNCVFCFVLFCLLNAVLQEYVVKTSKGSISVFVCGDQEKPALITYPDVALNCMLHFLLLFLVVNANFFSVAFQFQICLRVNERT